MRSVTVANLITRSKQRADLEGDDHVSDSEWQTLLSEMVGELHELADDAGLRYHETKVTITATGATSYTLPTDHLATIRISQVDANGRNPRKLHEVQIADNEHPLLGTTGPAEEFAIIGQTIEFYPNPSSGSFIHRYVPQPVDIGAVATSTTVDVICPSGEAFVIEGLAVKALRKSETDAQPFMIERDRAGERTKTWCMSRSLVTPRRMVAVDDRFDRDDRDREGSYRVSRP